MLPVTRPTVDEQIKILICETLDVDRIRVIGEVTFAELGADSLDQTELFIVIEDAFAINIEGEAMEAIYTVNDAIRAVKDCLKDILK